MEPIKISNKVIAGMIIVSVLFIGIGIYNAIKEETKKEVYTGKPPSYSVEAKDEEKVKVFQKGDKEDARQYIKSLKKAGFVDHFKIFYNSVWVYWNRYKKSLNLNEKIGLGKIISIAYPDFQVYVIDNKTRKPIIILDEDGIVKLLDQ